MHINMYDYTVVRYDECGRALFFFTYTYDYFKKSNGQLYVNLKYDMSIPDMEIDEKQHKIIKKFIDRIYDFADVVEESLLQSNINYLCQQLADAIYFTTVSWEGKVIHPFFLKKNGEVDFNKINTLNKVINWDIRPKIAYDLSNKDFVKYIEFTEELCKHQDLMKYFGLHKRDLSRDEFENALVSTEQRNYYLDIIRQCSRYIVYTGNDTELYVVLNNDKVLMGFFKYL
jgi:hypothetical protein